MDRFNSFNAHGDGFDEEGEWIQKPRENPMDLMEEMSKLREGDKDTPTPKPKVNYDTRWIQFDSVETGNRIREGYKRVRTKYIAFVKQYNDAKAAGDISLNPVELEALKKLHKMWTPLNFENNHQNFVAMKEHEHLMGKFRDQSESESPRHVNDAWNEYNKEGMEWRNVITEAVEKKL